MPIYTFLIKRSTVAGAIPTAGDLLPGELALNVAPNDGGLYYEDTSGNISLVRAGRALSASYAGTASLLLGTVQSASYALTASFISGFIESASFATNAVTASHLLGMNNITSSTAISASFAFRATSSSLAVNALAAVSSSYAVSASSVMSASFANSASYSNYANFASMSLSSSFAYSALNVRFADTASYVMGFTGGGGGSGSGSTETASYALMAEDVVGGVVRLGTDQTFTGTNIFNGDTTLNSILYSRLISTTVNSVSSSAWNINVAGDPGTRFFVYGNGRLGWGTGLGSTPDTLMYRMSSGSLKLDGRLSISSLVDSSGSYVLIGSGGLLVAGNPPIQTSSSFAITASYALRAGTASVVTGVIPSASYALTASYALNGGGGGSSISSSWASQSLSSSVAVSSSFATTASYAVLAQNVLGSITSASYALTASFALNGGSGGGSGLFSSSSVSASWASRSLSSSVAVSASVATTASYALVAQNVLGSITSASFAATASLATFAATASYYSGTITFPNGITTSGSVTASAFSGSGVALTGVISSSYSLTASYALNGGSNISASYALTASYALNGGGVGVAGDTFSYFDPAKPPVSASIWDDEFTTGPNVDAKWTLVNATAAQLTASVNVVRPSALHLTPPVGVGLKALLQPAPTSVTGSYIAYLEMQYPARSVNFNSTGIILSSTTASGAGNQTILAFDNANGRGYVGVYVYNAYSYSSTIQQYGTTYTPIRYVYLKKVSSSFFCGFSSDGATWQEGPAFTLTHTASFFGIFAESTAQAGMNMSYDFFRVFTDPTASLGGMRTIGNTTSNLSTGSVSISSVLGAVAATGSVVVNPHTATISLVDSLFASFSLSAPTSVSIDFDIRATKSGGAFRASLFDNNTAIAPSSLGWYSWTGNGNESSNQQIKIAYVTVLASGSHVIEVRHDPSGNTNAITFFERSLVVTNLSPITISSVMAGGGGSSVSASYALTASYALNIGGGGSGIFASSSVSSSWASQSLSSSFATTSSYALNAVLSSSSFLIGAAIESGSVVTGSIAFPRTAIIGSVATNSGSCRIRLYRTQGALIADMTRSVGVDPRVDAGVVADYLLLSTNGWRIPLATPVTYMNGDVPASSSLYYAMTSYVPFSTTINFTGSVVILQA